MKTIRNTRGFECVWLALGVFLFPICAGASAADLYISHETKIVGHIALPGTPIGQMLLQQEGRKAYLYVRQVSQPGYAVFDVTKPKRPKAVNHVSQRNLTMVDSGLAISEMPDNSSASRPVALLDSGHGASPTPELVRVINVTDPTHPRTIQTFEGVTSIVRDDGRSLIYIANGDGIWIVSHRQVMRRHLCSSSDAISSAIPNCD
jgi:hypothetical protein